MDTLCLKNAISGIAPFISISGSLTARPDPSQISSVGCSTTEKSSQKSVFSRFSFKNPLKSLWPGGGGNSRYNGLALDDPVLVDNGEKNAIYEDNESGNMGPEDQNGSWIFKILHVKSMWRGKQGKGGNVAIEGESQRNESSDDDEECHGCRVDNDDEAEFQFDRDSFSRMLRRVSLPEARLYAQLSYLGNLAYSIPKIKPENLFRYYGLRFVTSSMEKTELTTTARMKMASAKTQKAETNKKDKGERNENSKYRSSTSTTSYLHAQTKSMFPFNLSKDEVGGDSLEGNNEAFEGIDMLNTEVASLKATKEEVKQVVTDDRNLTRSSPCEWYICDDDQSGTRFFVIQGSESLASWQANLLFEPIQFEGFDVLVHRGIYEAAKGIYQQMLPEVHAHLKAEGPRATFRFTGHSLGGSLALLVNLMLLIRQEVSFSCLLPVITFGAPSIMCGGDSLLKKLGLSRSHVQAITLHRDIVSRAFSCKYPNHVAELLKAVNGSFRNHSCLNNQKILYAPMGEFLILQPDDKFSPQHPLLPPGCGLYLLSGHLSECKKESKQLEAAQLLFLNSPHPLEILRDRSAYGSGGTIIRDHDMKSYLKSIRTVIREELNSIRKARRRLQRNAWRPLLAPQGGRDASIVVGRLMVSVKMGQDLPTFSGILRTGKESWKSLTTLIASQHMHFFAVILLPARMLLLGAHSIIRFR